MVCGITIWSQDLLTFVWGIWKIQCRPRRDPPRRIRRFLRCWRAGLRIQVAVFAMLGLAETLTVRQQTRRAFQSVEGMVEEPFDPCEARSCQVGFPSCWGTRSLCILGSLKDPQSLSVQRTISQAWDSVPAGAVWVSEHPQSSELFRSTNDMFGARNPASH